MALNITAFPFPIFSPSPPATSDRPLTELRFSRWNNANAEPFIRRRRTQEQIERDLRLHRKYQSITNLTQIQQQQDGDKPSSTSPPPSTLFRSNGTPSSPSAPSIPGRRSKYSKPPRDPKQTPHPAFRKIRNPRFAPEPDPEGGISLSEMGISYRIKNAPFEFQYSYTETPKVKPLALREQPYLPFGPGTMPRPWTGRKPLPESKKELPEFDSFKLPPAGKKGVKPVQAPGPFLMGAGPKVKTMTREEVLGEPLTEEEVKELIKGCLRTRRQLNMGRDGLTHNMLDNIHSHWKRRRVCKIKCIGVCTVDMDNVRQQLEEKTGGKIIYSKGGVIYLFRGRNYNYKTRPKFPLMLWKPVAPVYPRLVQRAPEGLTLEEAADMRKRGRQLPPICKLGKNGVYTKLVKNVREAFEACELVRIDCQGMNRSDCRKIGAKLKDLVPCVLLSFEYEHILMWRGKDWKSSLPPIEDNRHTTLKQIAAGSTTTSSSNSDLFENSSNKELISVLSNESIAPIEDVRAGEDLETSNIESLTNSSIATFQETCTAKNTDEEINNLSDLLSSEGTRMTDEIPSNEGLKLTPAGDSVKPKSKYLDGVVLLLKQAVDGGSALILDDEQLDANVVYEKCMALARAAPAGPTFRHRVRKIVVEKNDKGQAENHEEEEDDDEVEAIEIVEERVEENSSRSRRREDFKEVCLDTVPQGSLRVDELAKLLA